MIYNYEHQSVSLGVSNTCTVYICNGQYQCNAVAIFCVYLQSIITSPPPLRNKLPVPYIAVKQYWPSLCVTLSQNLQNIIVLQRTIMASEDTQFISVNVGMRRWTIGIGRCTFSWFMQR